MAAIMLKLNTRDADILLKHMRWEDVRDTEEGGDVRIRSIYDTLRREREKACGRVGAIKRALTSTGLFLLTLICVEWLVFI